MARYNAKIARKYFPKERKKIDTVRGDFSGLRKADSVLMDAHAAWMALEKFRMRAQHNKQYAFGDQLSDIVKTEHGYKTERQSIIEKGNIPLQNNRIRGIVRTVVGVFQSQRTEPVCVASDRQDQGEGETMTMALQYVYRLNKLWGLDALNLNYFLISGLAASRSYYGWSNEKMDVWNEIVNPNYIFFDNHMKDPRHWDCTLVGQLHDVGIYDVMQKFSEGSKEKAERIRQLYGGFDRERTQNYADSLTDWRYRHHNINFFLPDAKNQNLCRVIEIWRKESKERYRVHDTLSGDFYKVDIKDRQQIDLENQVRIQEQTAAGVLPEDIKLIHYEWFVDNYWYYYFLTPKGDVLKEGETEYWHESHPFTFKIFNFYDGNVFPFVGDIIDQQHYINRIIMLQDFLYRASAKGVLAIPEECIPDDKNVEDFAEEWAKFNGVFVYKAKAGVPPPHQIVSNATQLGLTDMLQIQLKLLEDISGVHGALQGVTPNSGTPAALYAQQVQNSSTSLTEIFEAFKEFREERDMKNLKLIQQYYDQPRLINVSGNGSHSSYPLQFFDSVFGKAKEISLT